MVHTLGFCFLAFPYFVDDFVEASILLKRKKKRHEKKTPLKFPAACFLFLLYCHLVTIHHRCSKKTLFKTKMAAANRFDTAPPPSATLGSPQWPLAVLHKIQLIQTRFSPIDLQPVYKTVVQTTPATSIVNYYSLYF